MLIIGCILQQDASGISPVLLWAHSDRSYYMVCTHTRTHTQVPGCYLGGGGGGQGMFLLQTFHELIQYLVGVFVGVYIQSPPPSPPPHRYTHTQTNFFLDKPPACYWSPLWYIHVCSSYSILDQAIHFKPGRLALGQRQSGDPYLKAFLVSPQIAQHDKAL